MVCPSQAAATDLPDPAGHIGERREQPDGLCVAPFGVGRHAGLICFACRHHRDPDGGGAVCAALLVSVRATGAMSGDDGDKRLHFGASDGS